MKRIAILLLAASFMATVSVAKDSKPKTTKINGWVSDEKCGVKDIDNADCAKKCAEGGAKLVFVSDKDKSVLNVDNQDALKGHEGQYVSVTGSVDNGNLHVDKVAMAKEPAAKK